MSSLRLPWMYETRERSKPQKCGYNSLLGVTKVPYHHPQILRNTYIHGLIEEDAETLVTHIGDESTFSGSMVLEQS